MILLDVFKNLNEWLVSILDCCRDNQFWRYHDIQHTDTRLNDT